MVFTVVVESIVNESIFVLGDKFSLTEDMRVYKESKKKMNDPW